VLLRSLAIMRSHLAHHPHHVGTSRHHRGRHTYKPIVTTAKLKDDKSMKSFGSGPVAFVKCLWKRIDADRSLGLAAEMGFWLFLSLLPLAAVTGMVAAKLTLRNWATMAPLVSSLPGATQELLTSELGHLAAWNGGQVGIWAGVMFLWLASSGVHSIFDGIELQGDVPEAQRRPWWRKRLYALGACVALSVGIALLALLGSGVGWLWKITGGETLLEAAQTASSVIGTIVRLVVGAGVSFGLVAGLYWLGMPPSMRRTTPIVPGALVAVALQAAIGYGYGLYIKGTGDGSAYQAGLAVIGVTLMALFLFCTVLLVGIEVNQMLGERRQQLAADSERHPGMRTAQATT
jgi:membrane protein